MRLNSYEVLSRSTISGWRNNVVVASTIICINYFDYNSENWPVLGRKVLSSDFTIISTAILIFVFVSYLLHWYSDHVSFSKWFKLRAVNIGTWGAIGAAVNTELPVEGVSRRLKDLRSSTENANDRILELESISIEAIKEKQGDRNVAEDLQILRSTVDANKNVLEGIDESLSDLTELLKDMRPNFGTAATTAKIFLYGWYLALPIFLTIVALVGNIVC